MKNILTLNHKFNINLEFTNEKIIINDSLKYVRYHQLRLLRIEIVLVGIIPISLLRKPVEIHQILSEYFNKETI